MTMMVHALLRLHGDEDWEAWGDDWQRHVDWLCTLDRVTDWLAPPQWLRERPSRQLDWGAFLYEVSLAEVRRRVEPRTNYADIREDWDRPFREARERQDALLASLPEDGRYAVLWIECY